MGGRSSHNCGRILFWHPEPLSDEGGIRDHEDDLDNSGVEELLGEVTEVEKGMKKWLDER